MKLTSCQKMMYQTLFCGDREDYLLLTDYLHYLYAENVRERLLTHPLFAPSELWKDWAEETFVGFSTEKMLLQGGHAFPVSIEVGGGGREVGAPQTVRRCVRELGAALRGDPVRRGRDLEFLSRLFARHYRGWKVFPEHTSWYAVHPNPYFRCAEAHQLRSKLSAPERMLEIGAGACVNVAFQHSLYPGLRTVIIDLPETIFAGYTFLRAVLPGLRICLPHQVRATVDRGAYDVIFLLPMQHELVPERVFDLCFNMSSFQEMNIEVVNNYLRLASHALTDDGVLISVNQERSRYIQDNSLDKYDFRSFGPSLVRTVKESPFHRALAGRATMSAIIHCEVTKRSGR